MRGPLFGPSRPHTTFLAGGAAAGGGERAAATAAALPFDAAAAARRSARPRKPRDLDSLGEAEPVPFVLYDSRTERKGGQVTYDERIADRKDALVFKEGYTLMDYFLKR